MTDMMDIGISSLLAMQSALNVASNNISNASDSTYSRREITLSESPDDRGVTVADVSRVVDANAVQYSQATNMNYSQLSTYSAQLQSLVSLLGDNTSSIGTQITNSLGALRNLDNNPSSQGLRTAYLNALNTASQLTQTVNGQITTSLQNTNQSFTTDVGEINQILSNIANINSQIEQTQGQDQNSLLDQRDGLVDQLSQFMNFTTQTDSRGVMNISLSNGLKVVTGATPAALTTLTDPTNSQNLLIGLQRTGSPPMDLTKIITSGSIAGLYQYRQNAQQAQIGLGRLSLALAQSFNAQNQLGIDANGNFGGDIFNDVNSATAINSREWANQNNTGSSAMTVSINDVTQLQLSDYQLSIGAGNSYVLKRMSDNTVVSSGTISGTFPQTISADGFSIAINSGTFNSGDTYTISPTSGAASALSVALTDPSKLALAMPVATSSNAQNAGSGALDVTAITNPSNSSFTTPNQLNPPINVVFDTTGTHYSLINANTSAVIEGPIAFNASTGVGANIFPTPGGYDPGYRISITGTPKGNDSFSISYNSANSSDFRNGTLMENLYTNQILDNKKTNFNQAYDNVTTQVYTQAQNAQNQSSVAQKLHSVATTARDDESGVSLLEESMNLQRYQQAYQASAQIIQTAKTTFDALLTMFK